MKRIIQKLINLFLRIFVKTKNKILIIEDSFPSGSNTKILYDEIKKNTDYDIEYINFKEMNLNKIQSYVVKNYKIASSKLIISTHGAQKIKKKQISINIWHGIPLKSMNYMEKYIKSYTVFKDDYLITNSKFESTLLTACMFIPFKHHVLTGSPRLDYFNKPKDNIYLNELTKKFDKVIIYLPTFRSGHLDRSEGIFTGNLFNFSNVNYQQLDYFLKENNYLLVVKYHQNEMNKLQLDTENMDNILDLSNELLKNKGLDLYEVLPYTDLLITDYSSVYFDYLLLDKPILFAPTDLEKYLGDRGFLLEPYEEWTPGEKIYNQSQLESSIISAFSEDLYEKNRERLANIVFNKTQQSGYYNTQKLIGLIDSIMKNNKK